MMDLQAEIDGCLGGQIFDKLSSEKHYPCFYIIVTFL